QSITLTNSGASGAPSITISGTTISGTNANQFTDSFNDAVPVVLAPGQSTVINVNFNPTSTGAKTASLQIAHNGSNNPLAISLSGTGAAAPTSALGTSASSLTFGNVTVGSGGQQSITLTNSGASGAPSITISGTTISGTNANQFTDSFNDATPVVLAT